MENSAIDLMNSDWRDYRGTGARADRLEDAGWLEEFLRRWGYENVGAPNRPQLQALKDLRGLFFSILDAIERGTSVSEKDLDALNEVLAGNPLRQRVSRHGAGFRLEAVAARGDWTAVRGQIASAFAGLLADADPARLRRCDNEACRWVYFDESKSRSRRWCADVCGNLMKVRRFRERNRAPKKATE